MLVGTVLGHDISSFEIWAFGITPQVDLNMNAPTAEAQTDLESL